MRLYSLIICFCLTLAPSAFAVGEAPVRISGRVSLENARVLPVRIGNQPFEGSLVWTADGPAHAELEMTRMK
jgi:hypothetical protein